MAGTEKSVRSYVTRGFLALVLVPIAPLLSSGDDEKVSKQLAKFDLEYVNALTSLAKKYDRDQIPEAAHFFASCAIGLGSKDETLVSIKSSNEAAVYLGRLRGGEPVQDTAPIKEALINVSTGYKKILDPWIRSARKGELSESTRQLMLDTGVKYELSRGAHEYVQAIQRFNALRKEMRLRPVLWDCDESKKLILSGWYTCETEDSHLEAPMKESPFYCNSVEAARNASRGPLLLSEYPGCLLSFALVRQSLLNPNARTLRLGHWGGGLRLMSWGLYGIPMVPYRQDIPTPSQRFKDETLVKGWIDLEDIIELSGKKVPYVSFPYNGQTEVPVWFGEGRGSLEDGWANSEYSLLQHGGVPIMLRFFLDAVPVDVGVSLKDKNGGKHDCRVYVNGDTRVELSKCATILLLPESQLDGYMQYSVSVRCTIEGAPFEKSWLFRTGAK